MYLCYIDESGPLTFPATPLTTFWPVSHSCGILAKLRQSYRSYQDRI